MPQEVNLTTQAGVNINFVNTTVNSRVTNSFSTAPDVERHCQQYDIVWLAALRSHKVRTHTGRVMVNNSPAGDAALSCLFLLS